MDFKIPQTNCLGGGRYCEAHSEGVGTGQNILYEQLR